MVVVHIKAHCSFMPNIMCTSRCIWNGGAHHTGALKALAGLPISTKKTLQKDRSVLQTSLPICKLFVRNFVQINMWSKIIMWHKSNIHQLHCCNSWHGKSCIQSENSFKWSQHYLHRSRHSPTPSHTHKHINININISHEWYVADYEQINNPKSSFPLQKLANFSLYMCTRKFGISGRVQQNLGQCSCVWTKQCLDASKHTYSTNIKLITCWKLELVYCCLINTCPLY